LLLVISISEGLDWLQRVIWLGGSLAWFALVIWPPGNKPFAIRLGATSANILWCALVVGHFYRDGGLLSARRSYAWSITALIWTAPCVVFLIVVTIASLLKRRRLLERARVEAIFQERLHAWCDPGRHPDRSPVKDSAKRLLEHRPL
jgi:hypothetical protein